jgi:hypothetical protein
MITDIINSYRKELCEATTTILNCGDNIGTMKTCVDKMYAVYRTFTEIGIEDQNEEAIITSGGKAIAPSVAAHCLFEMKRTAVFLRGIYKAIHEKQMNRPGKSIIILYAGTGPYATLITPLLTCFEPGEIVIDLLEINPVSLTSALQTITGLGLEQFVGSCFPGDASTFRIEKHYDIVVSETMQAALKKEPQVSIMNNLIPQIEKEAIFIPETIIIDTFLESRGKWNPGKQILENKKVLSLGNLFTVDKENYCPDELCETIEIPEHPEECKQLKIGTTIRVYGDEYLRKGDCTLNMPVKVCELKTSNKQSVHFWYETGALPCICCRFEEPNETYKIIEKVKCYN